MDIIKILSHDVEVNTESSGMWSPGGMGRCSIKDGAIALNSDLSLDSRRSTIIHEVAHYISDMLSLELSEQQVDGIAIGMFSLLKDNPEYIKKEFCDIKE